MTTENRNFVRNVLVVLQGTLAAQTLNFFALPVVLRIFPPAAYGLFQASQVFVQIGLALAALRFEIAIVSANRFSELKAVIALCLWLNLLSSAILVVPCLVLPPLLFPGNPEYRSITYLGPLWFLAAGVLQTISYITLRDGAFRISAIGKGTQSLVNVIVAAGLGMCGFAAAGLQLADIAARSTAAAVQFGGTATRHYLMRPSRISVARMRIVAWRFRHFPMVSTVSAVLNVTGSTITPLLILTYFGAHIAGQFTLVDRGIAAAIGILSQSMSQVYMSDFARLLRDPESAPLAMFRRLVKILLLLSAVPAAILCLILPTVIPIVFGQQWHLAGELGQVMYPLFLSTFVVSPVNMTLTVMGRQELQLAWDGLRLASVLAVWTIAHVLGLDIRYAVALYAAVAALNYAVYLLIADYALRRHGTLPARARPEIAT